MAVNDVRVCTVRRVHARTLSSTTLQTPYAPASFVKSAFASRMRESANSNATHRGGLQVARLVAGKWRRRKDAGRRAQLWCLAHELEAASRHYQFRNRKWWSMTAPSCLPSGASYPVSALFCEAGASRLWRHGAFQVPHCRANYTFELNIESAVRVCPNRMATTHQNCHQGLLEDDGAATDAVSGLPM